MDTHNLSPNTPDDSAFPHIDGINMEVAVELLGQEIAKRAAEREDLMQAAQARGVDAMPIVLLAAEMTARRARQATLRTQDKAAVAVVFDRYSRSRK